jgi:hypothetical protein
MSARLEMAGEHVSGPSAMEYRARVQRTTPFAGRTVTSIRNAERLLGSTDLRIHHGDGMTCVYVAEQAECRKTRLAKACPADGPERSECRSTCQNLAYTDRDVDQLCTRPDSYHRTRALRLDQMVPIIGSVFGRHLRSRRSRLRKPPRQ